MKNVCEASALLRRSLVNAKFETVPAPAPLLLLGPFVKYSNVVHGWLPDPSSNSEGADASVKISGPLGASGPYHPLWRKLAHGKRLDVYKYTYLIHTLPGSRVPQTPTNNRLCVVEA